MKLLRSIKENCFLFQELAKRDFKAKYKGSVLGMGWSVVSPLLTLLVMRLVFTRFFGRDVPYYTTYIFSGTLVFGFFRDATKSGMRALVSNRKIISKINVSKPIFLLAQNVSSITTFVITLFVFYGFALIDRVPFTWRWLLVLYPTLTLAAFNIGVGLVLSALYVFFTDIQYLYSVFITLLSYLSGIFYQVSAFPTDVRQLFYLNPVYCHIYYVRQVVIDASVPSPWLHLLLLFNAVAALTIGILMYKKKDRKFIYYL